MKIRKIGKARMGRNLSNWGPTIFLWKQNSKKPSVILKKMFTTFFFHQHFNIVIIEWYFTYETYRCIKSCSTLIRLLNLVEFGLRIFPNIVKWFIHYRKGLETKVILQKKNCSSKKYMLICANLKKFCKHICFISTNDT